VGVGVGVGNGVGTGGKAEGAVLGVALGGWIALIRALVPAACDVVADGGEVSAIGADSVTAEISPTAPPPRG
jgi:hypothetical protein